MSPILGIIASSQTASTLTAFESIATATGTGSSGTITFNSIPSTYKHLQLRCLVRDTVAASGTDGLRLRVNGSTVDYTRHALTGDGSTVSATGNATQIFTIMGTIPQNNITANVMGVAIIDIHDYSSTTKYKTFRSISGLDTNGGTADVGLRSGLWMNTSAINSINLTISSGSFTTATTVALYGVKG